MIKNPNKKKNSNLFLNITIMHCKYVTEKPTAFIAKAIIIVNGRI